MASIVAAPEIVQPSLANQIEICKAEVVITPLREVVSNAYPMSDYDFIRRGTEVSVVVSTDDGSAAEKIYSKNVWQRGMYLLPVIPFYEQRLAKAIKKANRIQGVLGLAGIEVNESSADQ